MPKNSTLLPVAVVLVITFVMAYIMLTGRTNAPEIAGDATYPHYICTFNRYCEGPDCSDEARSIIAYLRHEDGRPRLEAARMSPRAMLDRSETAIRFVSTGGGIEGTLTIYPDRALDFTGTSTGSDGLVEHFGSGQCDRLVSP